MRPTNPTIPASATAAPVAALAAKNTSARSRWTATPSEAASSSPRVRRFSRADSTTRAASAARHGDAPVARVVRHS